MAQYTGQQSTGNSKSNTRKLSNCGPGWRLKSMQPYLVISLIIIYRTLIMRSPKKFSTAPLHEVINSKTYQEKII